MSQTQTAPTELGSESIGKLLKKYAVPGIIAMTASSLYNMVDSIYIGHIPGSGSLAISGLAVTFPLMNLSTALGTLVGVGAATMLSILLGQRNYKAANKVLANEVTLNCIIGLLFTVFCLAFLDPILYFFGASANTLEYARNYMEIILYGNVITHLYFGLNNIIRSSGNPKMAMGLTLFTVILNSILDPIFIFGFGMGVRGAALATVICQAVSLAYSLYYFTRKDNVLRLPKRGFELDWRIAKDSLAIGMGPFLMNSASCIVTMFINQQLLKYGGDLAIWYRQQDQLSVRHDRDGIQPGDAADRGLLFRGEEILPCARGLPPHLYLGDGRLRTMVHRIRILPERDGRHIHQRP